MLKKIIKFQLPLGSLLVFLICTGAYAQRADSHKDRQAPRQVDSRESGRDNQHRDVHRGVTFRDDRAVKQGRRYHYRDGRWYGKGWFGWEFAVSALVVGALVDALPSNHTVIVVGDTTYYYDNNRYYRQLPDGAYVVVRSPR